MATRNSGSKKVIFLECMAFEGAEGMGQAQVHGVGHGRAADAESLMGLERPIRRKTQQTAKTGKLLTAAPSENENLRILAQLLAGAEKEGTVCHLGIEPHKAAKPDKDKGKSPPADTDTEAPPAGLQEENERLQATVAMLQEQLGNLGRRYEGLIKHAKGKLRQMRQQKDEWEKAAGSMMGHYAQLLQVKDKGRDREREQLAQVERLTRELSESREQLKETRAAEAAGQMQIRGLNEIVSSLQGQLEQAQAARRVAEQQGAAQKDRLRVLELVVEEDHKLYRQLYKTYRNTSRNLRSTRQKLHVSNGQRGSLLHETRRAGETIREMTEELFEQDKVVAQLKQAVQLLQGHLAASTHYGAVPRSPPSVADSHMSYRSSTFSSRSFATSKTQSPKSARPAWR